MSAFWHRGKVIAIGFYGCRAADRIVPVRWSGLSIKAAPAIKVLKCPACSDRHAVMLMWRKPKSVAEWQGAEVRL